jgi:predicted metalloprotease with PDZ domain
LKEYNVQVPLSTSVDGNHDDDTPMDHIQNHVITVKFSRDMDKMTKDFGFTIKNTIASLPGRTSGVMIVPTVHKIVTSSEADRAGVCIGMRIIAVGGTTIHRCRSMPSSSVDYSPARHCKQMIIDAIQSTCTVNIRVDSCGQSSRAASN